MDVYQQRSPAYQNLSILQTWFLYSVNITFEMATAVYFWDYFRSGNYQMINIWCFSADNAIPHYQWYGFIKGNVMERWLMHITLTILCHEI